MKSLQLSSFYTLHQWRSLLLLLRPRFILNYIFLLFVWISPSATHVSFWEKKKKEKWNRWKTVSSNNKMYIRGIVTESGQNGKHICWDVGVAKKKTWLFDIKWCTPSSSIVQKQETIFVPIGRYNAKWLKSSRWYIFSELKRKSICHILTVDMTF